MKLILASLMMLVSSMVHAEWTKQIDFRYVMGDGDTRGSARQAALEQIKLKTANEAGHYVESTSTLHENGELTESIRTIGAAMVKLKVLEEGLTIDAEGQAVLNIKALASVDDSELAKRIEILRQDREKARQIKLLQADNESLRKELEEIRQGLSSKADPARVVELLTRQDQTIQRMNDNGATVTQVFERGTLLQLANHNSDALEKAKRDLDENLFAPLLRSKITAELESVEEDKGGYVALVRVGWLFDVKQITPVLNRYLNTSISSVKHDVTVHSSENISSKGPNLLSERIYTYLSNKGIDLKLSLAGKEIRLPALYSGNNFFDECSQDDQVRAAYSKHICLDSQGINNPIVKGNSQFQSNPIRIYLTRDEAERATNVQAEWAIWERTGKAGHLDAAGKHSF
jgi:hypothetical protein